MKFNEHTAISTARALLVPYDRHHVVTYHQWMQDPAIQEATASEPLTLEEEYENQESWRASHDKLTFIVCQPAEAAAAGGPVAAGEADAPGRMVGDVNLFLYPWDEDDPDEEQDGDGGAAARRRREAGEGVAFCAGEVDIMVADPGRRRGGVGRAAVAALLRYVGAHRGPILAEYAADKDVRAARLRLLMARIKEGNEGSRALFAGLGFRQRGGVNYFGEVTMVLEDLENLEGAPADGYREARYARPEGL